MITVLASAKHHTPAYNNQYHTLDSTNKAQTNFKYVTNVKIDGVSIGILKQAPDITTGYAYVNPQRLVESYINNTFNPYVDRITACADSIKYITLEFSEEYGSPVSGFAINASSNYHIWNASYSAVEFAGYTYSPTTFVKSLNLYPFNSVGQYYTKSLITQDLYFSWHRGFGTGAVSRLHVWAYDSSNNLIVESHIANPVATIGSNYERNLIYCNVSRVGLIDLKTNFPGDVTYQSVATDIIPSNTAYYLFRLETSLGAAVSTTYRVDIDSFCSIYEKFVLHFLNRYGAYDSMVFSLVSRETVTKREELYKKIPYTLDVDDVYRYRTYDSNTVVYSTIGTNKIQLTSDWITEAQAEHLRDLILSPDIKLEEVNRTTHKVLCKINEYESKKDVNDKLFNIVVDLEYSFEDVRQRG